MGYITQRFTPGFRLIDGTDLNNLVAQANEGLGSGSGPTYYVNETIGADANNGGQDPTHPLKTLDAALALESTALTRAGLSSVGRNAVVAFWGTQHRTSSLVWNLPGTHLVGIGAQQLRGKRARISVTGSTGFNKLVQVTAQGCNFANFGTFYGWTNSSSALLCWSDEAGRSNYDNVEFMGFGDNTASTGSANLTGSRALKFTGSGESTWSNCVFGVDTTDRNATNYTVEITSGAPRMSFVDCVFECRLGASGGSSSHFLIGAAGIDRYLDIVRCRFHNFSTTAMAQVLNVSASAGGTVFLDQSTFGAGGTAWQTAPSANVVMNMTPPNTGGGKAITNA
jgi:hypothetical protein